MDYKRFFEEVALDENGNIICVLLEKDNGDEDAINQKNFFDDVELTEEGYLKIYIN